MIDFTLFWFTLALLLVGVAYACLCTHAGDDEPPARNNVVPFARKTPREGHRG